MSECTIHSEGDAATDWRLVVTDDGEVEARKMIPYDGVRYYSTETRTNSARKNSVFGLSVAAVINNYHSYADVDVRRATLRSEVAAARGEAIDA